MKIKLARGPLANKRCVVEHEWTDRYEVRAPRYELYNSTVPSTIDDMDKRGYYQRSNVTLKDGTVVFEWMGWRS